jgi:two-component system, cell cycle response regulator DivK
LSDRASPLACCLPCGNVAHCGLEPSPAFIAVRRDADDGGRDRRSGMLELDVLRIDDHQGGTLRTETSGSTRAIGLADDPNVRRAKHVETRAEKLIVVHDHEDRRAFHEDHLGGGASTMPTTISAATLHGALSCPRAKFPKQRAMQHADEKFSDIVVSSEAQLVLVVDDVEDSRALYVEYFRLSGLRAEEAEDGEEAILKARALMPTVIIMDMAMPGLDGFEATRMLKSDAATSAICIVALTGHCEQHFRDRAFDAGVDLFLTKPCLPMDLLVHVQGCFARISERALKASQAS